MSQAYRSLPSEIYGIDEPGSLTAYCFDHAVFTFGRALEAALENHTGKNAKMKRTQELGRWLQLPDSMRFRSPGMAGAKKAGGA